jgi:NADPH2:quinone reductase
MEVLGAITTGEYTSALEFRSLPEVVSSSLNPEDVLIQVLYSDVNPVDLQKLRSHKSTNPSSPFVPGFGGSGTVLQVGSQVAQQHFLGKQVCFLADPSRQGSYATHIVVDSRSVAVIPNNVDVRDAACIPVAGLTAYESLVKLGLAAPAKKLPTTTTTTTTTTNKEEQLLAPDTTTTATGEATQKTLLIVGGAGGVGSWAITLARAWHPNLNIIATTTQQDEWCSSLGATQVIRHDEIETKLQGGREGSVEYILCLTEPTMPLFDALANVIRPYGNLCLVVAGKGIESLNMGFCFFKCAAVHCQTVFSSIRTKYQHLVPANELAVILALMARQSITAPLSPDLDQISEKFKHALQPNGGVLYSLSQPHGRRGKMVLQIQGGDELIFIDIKTVSLVLIPRRDCIKTKVLTLSNNNNKNRTTSTTDANTTSSWKEQASLLEKAPLIKRLTTHPTLGISKVADKQANDYQDGLEMQEAESVKNLWGVQLKKREKNVKGEELLFVDPKSGAIGEVSRKSVIAAGLMTVEVLDENGKERIQESIPEDERDETCGSIRQALKINLE